jgi:hypothetical protein
MKNENTISEHLPDTNKEDLRREEDLKAAAKRRDAYSLIRDAQADENNEAISRRLARETESEKQE